jgi:cytidine deaminase
MEVNMFHIIKDVDSLPNYIWDMVVSAGNAQRNAYAPYSNFKVGAAVRTSDGEVFSGCNSEESAYLAIHAEQNAIGTMVATVGRKLITDVVVIGGSLNDGSICAPCGHCRQWIREHSNEKTRVVIVGPEALERKEIRLVTTLWDLLPISFGPNDLGRQEIK